MTEKKKLTLKGRGRRVVVDSTEKSGAKRGVLSLKRKKIVLNNGSSRKITKAKLTLGRKKTPPKKAKKQKPPVKKVAPPPKVKIKREPKPSDIEAKKLNELMLEHYQVWRDFKPLKIDIHIAIRAWFEEKGWSYSKRVLGKAFKLHTRDLRYRKAIAAGGERYDLEGMVDGSVDELMQGYAQIKVEKAERRIIREKEEKEKLEKEKAEAEKKNPPSE